MSASFGCPHSMGGIVQNKLSVHRYIVRQYSEMLRSAEVHVHTYSSMLCVLYRRINIRNPKHSAVCSLVLGRATLDLLIVNH